MELATKHPMVSAPRLPFRHSPAPAINRCDTVAHHNRIVVDLFANGARTPASKRRQATKGR